MLWKPLVIEFVTVVIGLALEVAQQDIVNSETNGVVPEPLCLGSKENPDPSSEHFQKLYQEDATLKIAELVEMRTEFHRPSASEEQVQPNHDIVKVHWAENKSVSESPRVMG